MTPDLILTHARILTMDAANPRAEAVAIRVIVSAIKGSRAPLQLSAPFVLHGEGHDFTPAAEAVLRQGAALDGASSPWLISPPARFPPAPEQ